jgi:hypothetical protein
MNGFYCNVKAFIKEERFHYNALSAKLKTADPPYAWIRLFREFPSGRQFYVLQSGSVGICGLR